MKMLREILESELCRYCKRQDECCRDDYYCPAFQKVLRIVDAMREWEVEEGGVSSISSF